MFLHSCSFISTKTLKCSLLIFSIPLIIKAMHHRGRLDGHRASFLHQFRCVHPLPPNHQVIRNTKVNTSTFDEWDYHDALLLIFRSLDIHLCNASLKESVGEAEGKILGRCRRKIKFAINGIQQLHWSVLIVSQEFFRWGFLLHKLLRKGTEVGFLQQWCVRELNRSSQFDRLQTESEITSVVRRAI